MKWIKRWRSVLEMASNTRPRWPSSSTRTTRARPSNGASVRAEVQAEAEHLALLELLEAAQQHAAAADVDGVGDDRGPDGVGELHRLRRVDAHELTALQDLGGLHRRRSE